MAPILDILAGPLTVSSLRQAFPGSWLCCHPAPSSFRNPPPSLRPSSLIPPSLLTDGFSCSQHPSLTPFSFPPSLPSPSRPSLGASGPSLPHRHPDSHPFRCPPGSALLRLPSPPTVLCWTCLPCLPACCYTPPAIRHPLSTIAATSTPAHTPTSSPSTSTSTTIPYDYSSSSSSHPLHTLSSIFPPRYQRPRD